jgi:lactoylglutathione lyase
MKFCWITINVKDMERSLPFYRDLLGLPVMRKMSSSPDMEIVFLGSGETQVELICNKKAPPPSFGQDISLGFEVDSLEKFSEVLKSKNIPIHSGPFQPNPHIRFMYILDPDGVKVQLVENIK